MFAKLKAKSDWLLDRVHGFYFPYGSDFTDWPRLILSALAVLFVAGVLLLWAVYNIALINHENAVYPDLSDVVGFKLEVFRTDGSSAVVTGPHSTTVIVPWNYTGSIEALLENGAEFVGSSPSGQLYKFGPEVTPKVQIGDHVTFIFPVPADADAIQLIVDPETGSWDGSPSSYYFCKLSEFCLYPPGFGK